MSLNGSQEPLAMGKPVGTGVPGYSSLEQHVLQTLVYADIFDYPLTPEEVFRYLSVPATPGEVSRTLEEGAANGMFVRANGFYALRGREALIPLRERRELVARQKWAAARRYAHWLALVPFVRMVAVTGTLAVNNVEEPDDIDVLVITEPGRLWLARALVIAIVRAVRLAGDELCPNYFLSERALLFPERSYFAAREVAQMVPLYGTDIYRRVREVNDWVAAYLPQAVEAPRLNDGRKWAVVPRVQVGRLGRVVKRTVERLLRSRAGSALEHWEMVRKVRQLSQEAAVRGGSVEFTVDCCKGHFDHHDHWITQRFADNLARLGLDSGLAPSGLRGGNGASMVNKGPAIAAVEEEDRG